MGFGRLVFGVMIILAGIVLLLRSLNMVDIDLGELFRTYWPIILILLGVRSFVSRDGEGRWLGSILLITLGLVFLGRNLGWLLFSMETFWKLFWPAILVLIGIGLLTGGWRNRGCCHQEGTDHTPEGFSSSKGRHYDTVMGRLDLDLGREEFPEGETSLDFTAVMGQINILVPDGLSVFCNGTVVMGRLEFFDRFNGGLVADLQAELGDSNAPKRLRINCTAVMGEISVKTKI